LPFCYRSATRKLALLKTYWKSVKGYPERRETLGQWVRSRRLDLGLEQAEAATRLGVHIETLKNWESGRLQPTVPVVPRIIEFLGHNPLPRPATFPEFLAYHRKRLGLHQGGLAKLIGVNANTVWRWETGYLPPANTVDRVRRKVETFSLARS
jgi:transcriptional regulator with XRE-family HTH domain